MPRYYRFLGIKPRTQPDPVRWQVDVPTLGFTVATHRTVFGPWEPEHWQTLAGAKVPILVGKWDGPRDELVQKEGLAHDGSSLPARYVQALQGGHGLPDRFYCRVLQSSVTGRADSPAAELASSARELTKRLLRR